MTTEEFESGYDQTMTEIREIGWQAANDKYSAKYKGWPLEKQLCSCDFRKGCNRALIDTIMTAK